MLVTKNLRPSQIFAWTGHHLVWLTAWATLGVWLRTKYSGFSVPWLPVSLVGTAVAFYLGFKNNSAYDRTWEARKIWGGVVNTSRAWGSAVRAYVNDHFAGREISMEELAAAHRKLIHRHLAWLYQLRQQLLVPEPWEHAAQRNHIGRLALRYQERFGTGLFEKAKTLEDFLPEEEVSEFRR